MTSYLDYKKAEKKKEKQRAQAMFGSPLLNGKAAAAPAENVGDDPTGEEKKENATPPNSPSLRGGAGSIRRGEDENDGEFATSICTPTKEIRPKYVRIGDGVHKMSDSCSVLPRQSSLKKNRPAASIDRRVSFSREIEERRIDNTFDEGYDEGEGGEESFLEQNKEALILVGVAGLATLSVVLLRRRT